MSLDLPAVERLVDRAAEERDFSGVIFLRRGFSRTAQRIKRMAILGSDPGSEYSCSFYPAEDIQLIILTNLDKGLGDLRPRIVDALFG